MIKAGLSKKIIKIGSVAALTVVFLLVAMTMLGLALKNERQLSPWGTGLFVVATGSMEPTIPVGSLIFVMKTPADKIKENDVVTYLSANGRDIVTHRVREISMAGDSYVYITRGDANNADDAPLPYERVLGRVVVAMTWVSFVIRMFSGTNYVSFAIIGIGVILCAIGIINGLREKHTGDELTENDKV